MTIALGLLAKDGLVIAADTQETYSGLFKMDQGKILGTRLGPADAALGFVTVTGAGSASHLDSINQELCSQVSELTNPSIDKIERTVKKTIRDFHVEHITPFGAWPEFDRPGCSLVVGAVVGKQCRLWISDKSAVKQALYGAVGIGAPHANLMLGRLWRADMSLQVATRLAAYVVFWVKQNVDGCGRDTQIVLHEDSLAWICEVKRTELMEEQFRRYMELEERATRYMLGMGAETPIGGTEKQQRTSRVIRAELSHLFKNFHINMTESDYKRSRVALWTPDDAESSPQRKRLRRKATARAH
jgi:hypothetical protein